MTRTQKWVLALTSVAALMVALDQLVVATALNTIRADLHASITTLEWTVNAFSLSFAVLLITGAALGDRLGRRRMLVAGLVVFTAASAACALAPNVGTLIGARAVQGGGAALVMPLAVSLLSSAFPPERRGAAVGMFTALMGIAVVGGPLVGGAVTEGIAWQWIFWINVPVGLLLIPLLALRAPESHGPRARIDGVGLVLISAGMLGVVWGLIRGNTAGWSSAEVVTMLIAGVAATVAFIVWERRVAQPMLPPTIFADRTFTAANVAAFAFSAALFSAVFFLAQYLQIGLGYSPLGAGLRFLPWTLTLFVMAPLAGRLSERVGDRAFIAAGLALQAIGLAWVAWTITDGRGYASAVVALVIAGCGVSMAMPSAQNAAINAVARNDMGKAAGVYNTSRQLGGAFGVAILAGVFAANGSYASPAAFRAGVGPAMFVAAGLSLIGAIAGTLVRRRRPSPAAGRILDPSVAVAPASPERRAAESPRPEAETKAAFLAE